jgi:hypothetical protein
VPGIQPLGWHRRTRSEESDVQVWAEIVGRADENAKIASTYLVLLHKQRTALSRRTTVRFR